MAEAVLRLSLWCGSAMNSNPSSFNQWHSLAPFHHHHHSTPFPGFRTTPLEMEAVADKFDFNQDGFIDYREFVAALRWPDKVVKSN